MQKIAILYDASQAVLSTFDLDEVLSRILNVVRDHFDIANAAILLVDPKNQELYVRQHIGRLQYAADVRIAFGTGLTGTAVASKQPIYAPDVEKDARYILSVPSTRSELSVPLILRGEAVGVIDLQSTDVDAFDAEVIELVTMFSTQASIAIENARLYSLLQRRAAHLEAINAVAQQTTAVVEADELLAKVCRLVLEHFKVKHVAVYLREGAGLQLRSHMGVLTSCLPERSVLPAGRGLASIAHERGEIVAENDISKVADYLPSFVETAAEVCLPLIYYGEKLGVLALESDEPESFASDDLGAIKAVADICAGALKNCFSFDAQKQLAYRDGLTGIQNRRSFEERIAEEIDRAARYQFHLTVLMIDIDHFKQLNDDFGHMLGDEVLRQVSRILQQQLRKSDMLCRYGGEEFAVILPQISVERGREVAEKLRRIVGGYQFPGIPRPVTVSIGLAGLPQNGLTRDDVVRAADAALYEAKQRGRNGVVSAPFSGSDANAAASS